MDAKKFGAFIAECRKGKNMTQGELAIKLNVTDKAVSRWERGIGFPDINTIESLACALEVSVLELMKSERVTSGEVAKEEATDVIADTLGIVKRQRRIGLTRILLVLFAGTNILYSFGRGDWLLQTICLIGILVLAALLSFVLWRQEDYNRTKQAAVQGLYCGVTVWIAFGFSTVVGNMITSVLIITITALYVCSLKYF